jgi:hypothetical protein
MTIAVARGCNYELLNKLSVDSLSAIPRKQKLA